MSELFMGFLTLYLTVTIMTFLLCVAWAKQYSDRGKYELRKRYAQLALAAPLWPLMLLGGIFTGFHILIDWARGKDE